MEIFAARYALQVGLAAVPVEAPHPFVVQVEQAEQALARAGCRDRHDDLPPKINTDASSERHARSIGVAGRCHYSSLRRSKKRPGPDEPHGALLGLLPSAVVLLSGEDRGDRQRRVRERDEHLDGAAVVLSRATNGASVR
jgi:hypothetical protein